MSTISIKLSNQEVINTFNKIRNSQINNTNSNIKYVFIMDDTRITIYNSNAMTIQGSNSEKIYKKIFNKEYCDVSDTSPKNNIKSEVNFDQNKINSVGSDEVGVGDFFGGLIVASAYVKTHDTSWLKSIGVKDSKLLNDEKIIEIYNLIKNKIKHIVVIASPKDYNKMFNMYKNSHIIKAVMHNRALKQIADKIDDNYFIVIDEFASQKNYYNYLNIAKEDSIKIDVSTTKAESKYLCVACASIIARVHFLKQIETLSEELLIQLPLGASNTTIPVVAKEIIARYGKEKLAAYCKNHFITYNKIIGE